MAAKQAKLTEFMWEGVNQKRVVTAGEIEAPTLAQARATEISILSRENDKTCRHQLCL